MLPHGFEWVIHGRDLDLKLTGTTVALVVALDLGYGYRVQLSPHNIHRRTEFIHAKEQAVAYVEAWARRWQDRLRRLESGQA